MGLVEQIEHHSNRNVFLAWSKNIYVQPAVHFSVFILNSIFFELNLNSSLVCSFLTTFFHRSYLLV